MREGNLLARPNQNAPRRFIERFVTRNAGINPPLASYKSAGVYQDRNSRMYTQELQK